MALNAKERDLVVSFRQWLESSLENDERFVGADRHDRDDGSTLATRWRTRTNERVWFEVAVRPAIPQIRVGVLTDDRWKSEDFEQKIEESGDTMSEFVEMGFEDSGLTWKDPPVEHYREDKQYFYFATAFELEGLEALGGEAPRTKTRQMLDGYYHAFGPYLQ